MSDAPTPEKPPEKTQQQRDGQQPGGSSNERARSGDNSRNDDKSSEKTSDQGRDANRVGRDAAERKDAGRARGDSQSPKDVDEKDRVAKPADGIGFGLNRSDITSDQRQHMHDLYDSRMQAVREGRAKVLVEARASRAGTSAHNLDLTDARAANTKAALVKEFGIDPSSILTNSVGEGDAILRQAPDGKDNADDRVSKITFQDISSPDKNEVDLGGVIGDLNKGVPDKSNPDTIKEFGDRLKQSADTAKDLVPKVLSPSLLDKGKVALKVGELVGRFLADNQDHKNQRFETTNDVIPAYVGEVERQLVGHAVTRPAIEHSPYLFPTDRDRQRGADAAAVGRAMAREALADMRPENLTALRRKLMEDPAQTRKAIRFDLQRRLNH